jgi:hypothetical protein
MKPRAGNRRRPTAMGRLILLALEGPKHPRWLFEAILIVAIIFMFVVSWLPAPLDDELFLPALLLMLLVAAWMFVRYSTYVYYEKLADSGRSMRCLQCGYSLRGLHETRCPECGTDSEEMVKRARRLVWRQNVDPDTFSDEP